MDIVIIILGILFLVGLPVGKALAICAIIEGILLIIQGIIKKVQENRRKEEALLEELSKNK